MNALGYAFITAVVTMCAVMLARGYRRSRARMLFWSALSFAGFAVANLLLFLDLVVTPPDVNLYPLRLFVTLVAIAVLVFGFVWEGD